MGDGMLYKIKKVLPIIIVPALLIVGVSAVTTPAEVPHAINIDLGDYEYHPDLEQSTWLVERAAYLEAEREEAARVAEEARLTEEKRLADEAAAQQAAEQSQQAAEQSQQTSSYSSSSSGYYVSTGGSREDRIWIESRGDYGAYTGNGYVGAYQFSEQYLEGRMGQAGIPYNGVDDFLNSPGKQDALADWYADSRYGDWDGVPTTGGW